MTYIRYYFLEIVLKNPPNQFFYTKIKQTDEKLFSKSWPITHWLIQTLISSFSELLGRIYLDMRLSESVFPRPKINLSN